MSLAAATVWEIRPTVGSNTNGGGFVAGASGTDFSQQDTKNSGGNNSSTTDAVGNGTTTLTSAAASFTAAIVGNIIFLTGGSLTAGWYQVASFTNGTTIVLDRSPGTGTGATMNIGGALATVATVMTAAVAFNVIWIKATGNNVVTVTLDPSSSLTDISVIGYTTTRGDGGLATITTATNGVILFQFSSGAGYRWLLQNLNLTNTAGTRANGIKANLASDTQKGLTIANCRFDGFTEAINQDNIGFNAGIAGMIVIQTEIKNCTSHGVEMAFTPTIFVNCFIHDNAGNGVFVSSGNTDGDIVFERCVFYNNTLSGMRNNQANSNQRQNLRLFNCAFVSNTLDGLRLDSGNAALLPTHLNNIFYGNGGWGINSTTPITSPGGISWNNAYGGNSSGATTGWIPQVGTVTLTANPFGNPAGGDFTLNSTAGGGAACKGVGFPSSLP